MQTFLFQTTIISLMGFCVYFLKRLVDTQDKNVDDIVEVKIEQRDHAARIATVEKEVEHIKNKF